MKKIICEIANNGGVILITDMDDGETPNQFSAFATTAEAKSAFGSILDGMAGTPVVIPAAAAPETAAPVVNIETPAPETSAPQS